MRFMTSLRFIDVVAREGSIRKAADKLAITSTALNRRILQIEEEIGQPLFERLPGGVRLNTAGEIFVQHIRSQFADLARVQSQISDLSGIRRGHVRIASGADALRRFLPRSIAKYRAEHPAVSFDLSRCYGDDAEARLFSLDADLALIFAPIRAAHVHVAATLRQLLDTGMLRRNIEPETILESDSFEFMQNFLHFEPALFFQIPIAIESETGGVSESFDDQLVARPVDPADVPPGTLHICHLKGRVLPVAAAKFLDDIITSLRTAYSDDVDQ